MSSERVRVLCLLLAGLACGATPADSPAGVGRVTPVPKEVRDALLLSPFYKKYTDAGGLPVLSSDKVSDAALLEAADIVHHMLANRDDILRAIVRNKVRLAVMAPDEMTTDVPEHSDLTPKAYWDKLRPRPRPDAPAARRQLRRGKPAQPQGRPLQQGKHPRPRIRPYHPPDGDE